MVKEEEGSGGWSEFCEMGGRRELVASCWWGIGWSVVKGKEKNEMAAEGCLRVCWWLFELG